MENRFEIAFLDEALKFLDSVDVAARNKIIFNIDKSQKKNDPKLLKKISSDIWEFRTLYNQTHYRLFAFWDKQNPHRLIIATHGIIKKSQKLPTKEIRRAIALMNQYFKNNEVT